MVKAVGDVIEEDEPIVEIATDKVDSEVPAPCSGILKKVLFNEGDVVEVGSVFAIIDSDVSSENQDTPPLEPIISNEEIEIGKITSGSYGPSVNGPVAMGYIDSKFSNIGTKIKLEVRGKKYDAIISQLPFYKKKYVK